MNVPCSVHERGQDLQHYGIFENVMPHDLAYTELRIQEKWAEAHDHALRHEIAEKFYVERSQGVIQNWYSFTESQQSGLFPADWNPARQNIAIFNSSEDEFEAAGDEWLNPLYGKQQAGLERIVQSLSQSAHNIHLYLRVHPNLKGIDNIQTRQLATLKADFLTVIPADSPVSTYTLMKHANKVVSFGSTAGIEAVFWGVPSILAGRAYYESLGGTYNPGSHEELIALLHAPLSAKDKTAALMYGYYWNSYGLPFKYYEALGMNDGRFKGKRILPTPTVWQRLLEKGCARVQPLRNARRALFAIRSQRRVTGSARFRLVPARLPHDASVAPECQR